MMKPTAASAESNTAATLRVRGTVQGVGFRPTVWQLAHSAGLHGYVANDAGGVLIFLQGSRAKLEAFPGRLRAALPPLAQIDSIEVQAAGADKSLSDFRIIASRDGLADTAVCADAASCPDCLAEIRDPANRRYGYAFTNCTNCGPRFSIIRRIPYDRANTSMAEFQQCTACAEEYHNPADRRFHAQPNACPDCGPRLWYENHAGETRDSGPLAQAVACLRGGGILAIKGIGGFHLACDAGNADALETLRRRKHRPVKPLALMARDISMVQRYATLNEAEQAALCSAAAPVVVLPRREDCALPEAIAPGLSEIGFMLPYSPLHALLCEHVDGPLIMTSGNPAGRPQCTGNEEARTSLAAIADGFLMHDRTIENRVDDSVVRCIDGEMRFLRRARGYAPAPLPLPPYFDDATGLTAYGAELKNTFAIAHGRELLLSQHIGDLEDAANLDELQRNIQLWHKLFSSADISAVADRHPEYLSTKLAQQYSNGPLIRVQHHHAHFAACLGDNGVAASEAPCLGIVLDGLGLGEDDSLWGGEILLGNYHRCQRVGGLAPVALPGAAQAIRQPWRNLYARLSGTEYFAAFASAFPEHRLMSSLAGKPLKTIDGMLQRRLNCPPCSSAGRLFDAVAAALGLAFDAQSYEGEAAMQLESLASRSQDNAAYPLELRHGDRLLIDDAALWPHLLLDLGDGVAPRIIARRFHNGLAAAFISATCTLAEQYGVSRVALSGGVFQNRILSESVSAGLRAGGLEVLQHRHVPANDGGIAFGQLLVALASRNRR
ncbi:carbamoyltransferase HypF [Granulosicoccaceae sp. 1_MG-2023]|nr:carbamoyltransferase HypF [Granulosicoccaceae sp. 1_MG-2023]